MPLNQIDFEGNFRGIPREWGINETKGGAVEWTARVELDEMWMEADATNEEGWYVPDGGGLPAECYLHIVIIKKDGTPNQTGIDQMKAIGWDGNWDNLYSEEQGGKKDWSTQRVQVRVESEVYNGKSQMKVKWLSGPDDPVGGGGIKTASADRVKSLSSQYGAATRALCGGQAAVPPPPGRAKSPTRAASKAAVAAQAPVQQVGPDGIPF